MATVCLVDPRGLMLSFGRNRPYIIGRDKAKVSMCISHRQISRKHAVISWKSSGWVITDHSRPESDSGVMINGTKLVKYFEPNYCLNFFV